MSTVKKWKIIGHECYFKHTRANLDIPFFHGAPNTFVNSHNAEYFVFIIRIHMLYLI